MPWRRRATAAAPVGIQSGKKNKGGARSAAAGAGWSSPPTSCRPQLPGSAIPPRTDSPPHPPLHAAWRLTPAPGAPAPRPPPAGGVTACPDPLPGQASPVQLPTAPSTWVAAAPARRQAVGGPPPVGRRRCAPHRRRSPPPPRPRAHGRPPLPPLPQRRRPPPLLPGGRVRAPPARRGERRLCRASPRRSLGRRLLRPARGGKPPPSPPTGCCCGPRTCARTRR